MKEQTNTNSGAHGGAECPGCGSTEHETAVRQYENMPGIVDVGFKCRVCGHEWGFDVEGHAITKVIS